MSVHGAALPGFERVRDAFQNNFDENAEVGAACCVYVDGKVAVDLWGGLADPATGRAWEADTPTLLFSSTKGLTTICMHRLVQQGALDLDAPVAKYWPAFAAEGKGSIPVRWVLSHRAGVPAVDRSFTLEDVLNWHAVVAAVAAQKPDWEPGSRHGYHARTFGWIAGEIVRRITGRSPGRFFADEVAGPLGVDCWIGLPEGLEFRLAAVVPPPPIVDPQIKAMMDRFMGPGTLLGRVMNKPDNLFAYDQRWNTRPYHAAELPSTNGIGSARALSKIYAACIDEVDGIRLLDPAAMDAARTEQSAGPDAVLGVPTRFSLGFSLTWALSPRAPEGSFGFAGAGGSLGFADPANRIAFAYVMNRMVLTDFSRSTALVNAVYQSLESR
jgi:CubicO group peptidase (beta-lactamase class C family)